MDENEEAGSEDDMPQLAPLTNEAGRALGGGRTTAATGWPTPAIVVTHQYTNSETQTTRGASCWGETYRGPQAGESDCDAISNHAGQTGDTFWGWGWK
jgi:hypothetical protein